MGKAILKYNLSDKEDMMEHTRAMKATDMALALWEFAYNNRKYLENQIDLHLVDDKQASIAYEMLELVYDSFWEIMKDYDLNLEKLVE